MITRAFLAAREAARDEVRVCVVGPGFIGGALIRHIERSVPGMRVAAVVSRQAHERGLRTVDSSNELDEAVLAGHKVIVSEVRHALDSRSLEVIVDATGAIEFGAKLALSAINARKPLVTLNAEVEGTVGPILDAIAAEQGVLRTIADGDQPGVQLRLAAFAQSIGLMPRVLGNIKGLQDVRRNPETQLGFARRWNQNVNMVTSFADGTKISFEQAVVANILGLTVQRRGMIGRSYDGHVDGLAMVYDIEELRSIGGVVDYVVGASPSPGVYCLSEAADSAQSQYLELFKMGTGPLYSLYTPYHLCHLEVPATIASVVGFGAGLGNATNGPRVEVCAVAKTDLRAGTLIDGLGGFHTYGHAVSAPYMHRNDLLPMGVADGCTLVRDIEANFALTYDDVSVPTGRTIDALRRRQKDRWPDGGVARNDSPSG